MLILRSLKLGVPKGDYQEELPSPCAWIFYPAIVSLVAFSWLKATKAV
jgi:hypothetical protein